MVKSLLVVFASLCALPAFARSATIGPADILGESPELLDLDCIPSQPFTMKESTNADLAEAALLAMELGSDDFFARERAESALYLMAILEDGDSVKRVLALASHTQDLEVRDRIRRILSDVEGSVRTTTNGPQGLHWTYKITAQKGTEKLKQWASVFRYPFFLKTGDNAEQMPPDSTVGDYSWVIVKQEWCWSQTQEMLFNSLQSGLGGPWIR